MRPVKAAALLLAAIVVSSVMATQALAAPTPKPAWTIQTLSSPSNFVPGGDVKGDSYEAFITNSGGAVTDKSPIEIVDTLPKGLTVKGIELYPPRGTSGNIAEKGTCKTAVAGEVSTVSCEVTNALAPPFEAAKLFPDDQLLLTIRVAVPATASGALVNEVKVKGGGADPASAELENRASEEVLGAGFRAFSAPLSGPDGKPATAAASHPYEYTTSFAVNLIPELGEVVAGGGDLRQIEVDLPEGLAGDPTAIDRCSAQQFNTTRGVFSEYGNAVVNDCPNGSVAGVVAVQQLEGGASRNFLPLYNLIPPKGMPAQFGFQVLGAPIYIDTKVRSGGDYGVSAYLDNVTEANRVAASRVMIWGTPWEESHDPLRGECIQVSGISCHVAGTPRPFLRLPTSCASPLLSTMSFETWTEPPATAKTSYSEAAPTGCEAPPFTPAIEAKPTTNVADAPSGLHFALHLPQAENEDPDGLAEADLKDVKVALPEGLLVNPSSANGLGACSEAEAGYLGVKEGRRSFSPGPADCPDAAKIGTVEIDAPAVDHPLAGAVYLAKQGENPFNSLLALYITVFDPVSGVVVKLPAEVKADSVTGRLTTTVIQNPQLPFEDLRLNFNKGARAPLRTPALCGTHTTTTALTPWSSPAFGPDATPSDSFETTQSPSGGACPTSAAGEPNAPSFEAGSESPIAGAYSPFVLHLARQDGSQELKALNLTLPAGMAAKFAGVAECPDGAIAAAEAKSGAQEQATPSCPASSQLGTVTVGAGAGPAPYYVKGKAYLSGPYKNAPLSMAVITPALAGPFDLGTVVVHAPLYVDPETAQATVKSSLPTILQGIPLDIRSIAVSIDRHDFTLNPTSCEEKAVSGEAISTQGQSAALNNRFQVGSCANLGFKPKLSLKLKGGTKRGGHPALTATVTYPKAGAYANIAFAQVALPHSEFLDQGHIGTVCTRVQFAADQCPAKSVYGHARAITPLFDKPLEGPVYLRSSNNELPDLVADLNGQVEVVLDGKNDSIHGGIRNTFEAVPDAPVTKFTLSLLGAKKGLLENSTDICAATHKAQARFIAHNGKVIVAKPKLVARCGRHGKKQSRRGNRRGN